MFCDIMAMKLLGRVSSIHDGKLIIKCSIQLKKGKDIYDDGGEFAGDVIDWFGPVKEPYLVISTKKDPERYLGEKLYY